MASSGFQRKQTAILSADVVGYFRHMGDEQGGFLKTLTEYRQVFSDHIEKFRGRIVHAPDDAILAEPGGAVKEVGGTSKSYALMI